MFQIASGRVLQISNRKAVVVVSDEGRQAFYQSKGSGSAPAGQWVPFFGIDFNPRSGSLAFFLHPEGKNFPEDTLLGQMARWLAGQELVPTDTWDPPLFHQVDGPGRLELLHQIVAINELLTKLGAASLEGEARFGASDVEIIQRAYPTWFAKDATP